MAEGIVERMRGPDGSVVEVLVKAPVAEMKMAAKQLGMDTPTEQEITQAAIALAQAEYDEANVQKIAASTIATVAVALAYAIMSGEKLLTRSGGRIGSEEVRIPRWIVDRVTGAKLGISETADRDVILRWRTRAERPIEPEEMRLDA